VAVAGPQAQHVRDLVVTSSVTASGVPGPPASQFQVGQPVYVATTATNITDKQPYSVTIYVAHDTLVQGATPVTVSREVNVYFQIQIPATGLWFAKVYWDAPSPARTVLPNEQYFAAGIAFLVQ
jgi:hypothetical protein